MRQFLLVYYRNNTVRFL